MASLSLDVTPQLSQHPPLSSPNTHPSVLLTPTPQFSFHPRQPARLSVILPPEARSKIIRHSFEHTHLSNALVPVVVLARSIQHLSIFSQGQPKSSFKLTNQGLVQLGL